MKITYYGHSCVGIETAGKTLLADPFITGNPKAFNIDIQTINSDYLLLTHAHYDHISDVESIADRNGSTIICNHEMAIHFQEKGYKCHEMNFGGSHEFDFGKLKMVYATHSSSFPDHSYGGNPAGFVLSSAGKTIYLAGDTALTMDMKLIPMFFKLDLAVLPLGGNFTMDVDEAVVAAEFVECDKVMGIHYDTMPIIEINHKAAKKKFSDKGKELILLNSGESIEV